MSMCRTEAKLPKGDSLRSVFGVLLSGLPLPKIGTCLPTVVLEHLRLPRNNAAGLRLEPTKQDFPSA